MKCRKFLAGATVAVSIAVCLPAFGQAKKDDKPAGQPSEAEMMAEMMKLAQPGENHKLLEHSVGTWIYTVKMWMNPDPAAPPSESTGTAEVKAVLGGRYFMGEQTGKVQMPGTDGKMMEMEFKGMSTEGYDNIKKKFVATWIDNAGTAIMALEGTYDPATKSFTYSGEEEPMPGMKAKVREVVKDIDHDHRSMEWYEVRDGKEVKTVEIIYTRKK